MGIRLSNPAYRQDGGLVCCVPIGSASLQGQHSWCEIEFLILRKWLERKKFYVNVEKTYAFIILFHFTGEPG